MKKLLLILLFIPLLGISQSYELRKFGLRFPEKESFTLGLSVDPFSSFKEHGLDIVPEIEYMGKVYAKIGFESFSALQGGYTDFHGAFGINLTSGINESWRYYGGVRSAVVWRDKGFAWNPGIEGGIDYDLTKNLFIGLRGTGDYRLEQKVIFNWKPELKFSGFVRVGFKWDWKK